MISLQHFEFGRIERLSAQADAVHAALGQQIDQRRADVDRIGFDAEFVAGREREPAADDVEQPCQAVERQMRGRAAADEQRIHLAGRALAGQFEDDRLEIAVHQVVTAGQKREIAIPAAVRAERHVDVSRSQERGRIHLGG